MVYHKYLLWLVTLINYNDICQSVSITTENTVPNNVDRKSESLNGRDAWQLGSESIEDKLANALFYKFSENDDYLTRQEVENLIRCSLEKSSCPNNFDLNKNVPYSNLTNCSNNQYCTIFQDCQNPAGITDLVMGSQQRANIDTLKKSILPLIVAQSQLPDCFNNDATINVEERTDVTDSLEKSKPSKAEIWGYGFLFVTLISACSLVGVSVLPLMAKNIYKKMLSAMIGLAAGSLAASSLFHLMPAAFGLADYFEHHSYLFSSLYVILGLWAFLMIERFIKIAVTYHNKYNAAVKNSSSSQVIVSSLAEENAIGLPSSSEGSSHPVGGPGTVAECRCSHGEKDTSAQASANIIPSSGDSATKTRYSSSPSQYREQKTCSKCQEKEHVDKLHGSMCQKDVDLIFASQQQAIKASFGHQQKPAGHSHQHHQAVEYTPGESSVIRTVAWMIIFGDGVHNFLDGVSIGAAFSTSKMTGISISLAVMCEELPHELGDFAVLLNAGMSMGQALMYNFLSATTCYAGLVLGILLGEFTQNASAIFGLAAGMFLYISCVDMIPELNEELDAAAEKGSKWEVIKLMLLQNIGFGIGVFSLFALAYFQDEIVLG